MSRQIETRLGEISAQYDRDTDWHSVDGYIQTLVPNGLVTLTIRGSEELVGPLAELVWEGIEKLKAERR